MGPVACHADTTELGGFSWLPKSAELAALLNDAQSSSTLAPFQWANDGHDNHDTTALTKVADLHATAIFIH